jgi:arylsulfatase A-like enzyme
MPSGFTERLPRRAWPRVAAWFQLACFVAGCRARTHESAPTSETHVVSVAVADAQALDATPSAGPNVLVMLVDTMRADRLGVAGYRRSGTSLTPNLDAFAATATRFTHAYAQAANTPKSFPSIMTSRLPSQIAFHNAFHNFPAVLDSNVMLFEALAGAGLYTASFSSHFYFEPRRNVRQGVIEYDNAGARDLAGSNLDYAAPRVVPKAITRLESLASDRKRFAMFVHLFEAHSTYIDHPEHPVTTRGEAGLVERYDYELAIDDDWIGKLLATLDRTKLADNTVVVILSDHGEAFGTHTAGGTRAFFHGQTLYDEVLRVPLLIRVPGIAPSVSDDVVGLLDVAPTIVDAAGVPPPSTFTGRSLLPLARGRTLPPRPVRAEILPTPDLDDTVRALVTADGAEKIIVSGTHAPEVYDLRKDAGERTNLAPRDPARLARLRALLDSP